MLKRTYQMKPGPVAPSWDRYAECCRRDWDRVLAKDPPEREVQEFLERTPSMVPGAWTPHVKSGHYPLHCMLISQPELPGLASHRPDFMWIATHSGAWYPTLVEIERPGKLLYTQSGTPSAGFSQARHQLAEWRTWFNDPANQSVFAEAYGIPDYMRNERQMELHMILVYGRRSELQGTPHLAKQRHSLMSHADEALVSYDRLEPDRELSHAITAHAQGHGRYRVLHVPPVFRLGPNLADRLSVLDGLEDAVRRNASIPGLRRKFIVSRIPYWRDWSQRPDRGTVDTGDCE